MTKTPLQFRHNGRDVALFVDGGVNLLVALRELIGDMTPKFGCGQGGCGACSVLIDGVSFYSCHTLAMEAVGKKIFTVEGLGDERNLHALQKVAHIHNAAECGFCTPGWEVTAKGLLDKNANPSVDEVKAALSGHLCRCAAYEAIIATVIDTGRVLRGEAEIV
jgi:carbon-monoxide dehydrogenase small subunit